VELNLLETGYTISFDRSSGARAYTTAIIPYNSTSVSGLYQVEFTYADGGDDPTRSGYYLDNITVVIPEPATMALLLLGGVGLLARRRRKRAFCRRAGYFTDFFTDVVIDYIDKAEKGRTLLHIEGDGKVIVKKG
jgi:hypothetical protein